MSELSRHYRQLLGLDDHWNVESVELSLEQKRVVIVLQHMGKTVACPECSSSCSVNDYAPERSWRHLDTMQFETLLKARLPRANCRRCGVKTCSVPWSDKYSRFTLMFEAFVIEVLQASSTVAAASVLLGLGWDAVHDIMKRAVERGVKRRQVDDVKHVGID
jgi:transposase